MVGFCLFVQYSVLSENIHIPIFFNTPYLCLSFHSWIYTIVICPFSSHTQKQLINMWNYRNIQTEISHLWRIQTHNSRVWRSAFVSSNSFKCSWICLFPDLGTASYSSWQTLPISIRYCHIQMFSGGYCLWQLSHLKPLQCNSTLRSLMSASSLFQDPLWILPAFILSSVN